MIYFFSVCRDCTNPHLISKYVHLRSPSYSSIYPLNDHLLHGYFVPSLTVLDIIREEGDVAPVLKVSQPGAEYCNVGVNELHREDRGGADSDP